MQILVWDIYSSYVNWTLSISCHPARGGGTFKIAEQVKTFFFFFVEKKFIAILRNRFSENQNSGEMNRTISLLSELLSRGNERKFGPGREFNFPFSAGDVGI
jgi:hypothetical protein